METKTKTTEARVLRNWGPLQIETNTKKEMKTKIGRKPCVDPWGFLNLRDLNTLLLKYIGVAHAMEETEGGTDEKYCHVIQTDESQIQHLENKYEIEVENWNKLWKDAAGKIADLNAKIINLEAEKRKLVKIGKGKDGLLEEKNKTILVLVDEIKEIKANLCCFLSHREIFDADLVRLHAELAYLTGELNAYTSFYETEKMRGADLEARLKTLEHNYCFQISILENNLKNKREKSSKEVTNLELRIKGEFAARLKVELEMLRNMFEETMRDSKERFEMEYKSQISQLELQLNLAVSRQRTPEDKEKIRLQITELESRITHLKKKTRDLSKGWSELTVQLKTKKTQFCSEMSEMEFKITHLKEENVRLHSVYEELSSRLMMTKVEVGVYDKLLSPEMERMRSRHGDSFCLEEACEAPPSSD